MESFSNATSLKEATHLHISNLLYIIRCANERYSRVAAALRHSLRPTYHARKRARSLKLRVSIEAALKLDPRQISTIPLPIIEVLTPLPREAPRTRPTLRCDIPEDVTQEKLLSSVSVYSCASLYTDASPIEPSSSHWSTSSADTDDEGLQDEGEVVSESDDHEDEKEALASGTAERRTSLGHTGARSLAHLDVPVDANRFSWSSYLSCDLSSESSSSSNSSGPVTPETNDQQSVTCVKRKSKPSDDIDISEKRPKYARKSWVNTSNRRILIKMTSVRN